MTASCATACGASGTGGTGRGCYGLAAVSFTNETAGRHEFGDLFTAAEAAFGFIGSKDQTFKIFTAFFTAILINRHQSISFTNSSPGQEI
jgi:hypothetical protein